MLRKVLNVSMLGFIALFGFAPLPCSIAAERPTQRVLYIGIDGCRPDALRAAKAPNLQGLAAGGAATYSASILNPRGDKAETVSGPGWSNLLTGVWPDKHGVLNNTFKGRSYEAYPHFFAHVREAYPAAKLHSFVTWTPIKKYIVSAADESEDFTTDPKKPDYAKADTLCLEQAIRTLETGDPDVLMVYQGQVDEAGHAKGFHPTVEPYIKAIETVDGNVGKLLTALKARPNFEKENWLILVSTDHGGKGTSHSGRENGEVTTIFQIVNGPAAAKGPIEGPTYQVDLVATALTQLGIPLKPEWKLDGKPIGLKK